MIDDAAMAALRVGASLAYALPRVRLRIRSGGRPVLDVHRPPFDESPLVPALPPCGFRRAVAAAYERVLGGERLALLGLPDPDGPAVEVGLAAGDRSLPGDLYRVTMGGDWLHVFATTLPIDRCVEAAGDGVQTRPDGGATDRYRSRVRVGFHRDDATDVTLVHTASPVGCLESAHRGRDALEGVYGRCAVVELEDHLIAAR